MAYFFGEEKRVGHQDIHARGPFCEPGSGALWYHY